MPIHSVPDQTERILKKLKPTKTFLLSDADFEAFVLFVKSNEPDEIRGLWRSLNQNRTARTRPQKSIDPKIQEAIKVLKEFCNSRGLLAAESANAYISFSAGKVKLPKPTKTAMNGIPGAVKWLAAKSSSETMLELARGFVEAFTEETDYSYERRA